MARQVCDVLSFLHLQSPPIIYKDIKPQNIILSPDVKIHLIDFGISREYDPTKTTDTKIPSTEDILNAVEKINADDIFVFPNNSNIILVSEQAAKISKKRLHVIKTKQIPQAFSSLFNFDESLSVDENIELMTEAISNIKVGQITYALRDTEIEGVKIKKDDFMGLNEGKITVSKKKIEDTFEALIDQLIDGDSSIVSIYYGEDVKEKDAEKLAKLIEKKYEDVEVELVYGGQPLYYYLISVE